MKMKSLTPEEWKEFFTTIERIVKMEHRSLLFDELDDQAMWVGKQSSWNEFRKIVSKSDE